MAAERVSIGACTVLCGDSRQLMPHVGLVDALPGLVERIAAALEDDVQAVPLHIGMARLAQTHNVLERVRIMWIGLG